ncbi:hypothetical protein, partial [Lacticaseibacillus rhamnosus]|uniref:hypothetical protein n=1 Tax=Lacticaseibacillus rhamnosus TaxID=47715 RepID=UPI001E293891
ASAAASATKAGDSKAAAGFSSAASAAASSAKVRPRLVIAKPQQDSRVRRVPQQAVPRVQKQLPAKRRVPRHPMTR